MAMLLSYLQLHADSYRLHLQGIRTAHLVNWAFDNLLELARIDGRTSTSIETNSPANYTSEPFSGYALDNAQESCDWQVDH